MGVKVVGA